MHEGETSKLPTLSTAYCLTFSANITQQFPAEVAGGVRLDFSYSSPGVAPITVVTPSRLHKDALELLVKTELTSGNDWVVVSESGIVDFDSHVTLATSVPVRDEPSRAKRLLITARIRGRGHLNECLDPRGNAIYSGTNLFDTWKDEGLPTGSCLPVDMSVTFEVPVDAPVADPSRIGELANSLFVGVGKITFQQGKYGRASRIEADLYVIERPVHGSVPRLAELKDVNRDS